LKKLDGIERLKYCKPREFWKYFKPSKDKNANKSALDDFYAYFSNLENDVFQSTNAESETCCNTNNFNHINVDNDVDDLDMCITVDEINLSVTTLKRSKAHGSDMLLNEYFIECIDILAPSICDIFNAVFNSGCYPEEWLNGIIVALHNKGDNKSVDNYRVNITLLSCLSKLFTSDLNGRIEKFCEKNSSISNV